MLFVEFMQLAINDSWQLLILCWYLCLLTYSCTFFYTVSVKWNDKGLQTCQLKSKQFCWMITDDIVVLASIFIGVLVYNFYILQLFLVIRNSVSGISRYKFRNSEKILVKNRLQSSKFWSLFKFQYKGTSEYVRKGIYK